MSEENNILRMPMLYRIVFISVTCFTVICSVCILLFQFEEWPLTLLFLGFVGLPYLIMFITYSLWRVDVKDDGFIYRNFFGRKTEYKYEDLKYEMHPKGLKWYFYKGDKKVFCMAYYVENGDRLEKMYRKHIEKLNKN